MRVGSIWMGILVSRRSEVSETVAGRAGGDWAALWDRNFCLGG